MGQGEGSGSLASSMKPRRPTRLAGCVNWTPSEHCALVLSCCSGMQINDESCRCNTSTYLLRSGISTTQRNTMTLPAAEADPHMRMLLQWRISRKRALLAAISQLSASLALRHKVQSLSQ